MNALTKRLKANWFHNVWLSALLFPLLASLVVWGIYSTMSNGFVRFLLMLVLCYIMTSPIYSWHDSLRVYYALRAEDYEEATRIVACSLPGDTKEKTDSLIIHRSNALLMQSIAESVAVPLFYFAVGGLPLMTFAWAVQWSHHTLSGDVESEEDNPAIEGVYSIVSYVPEKLFSLMVVLSTRLLYLPLQWAWNCFCVGFVRNSSLPFAIGETALGIHDSTISADAVVEDSTLPWLPEAIDTIRMSHIAIVAISAFVVTLFLVRGTFAIIL